MRTPPVWVRDAADSFWDRAPVRPPLPRDLGTLIPLAVSLAVVRRPGLRLRTVLAHLAGRGIPAAVAEDDRPLRACLFCRQDAGLIFLDSHDPPDEQRFSLAHELAHFLRDYDGVRRRVARTLGPAAVAVLDGLRPPTVEERLHAVLRAAAVGPQFHLLGRDEAGRPQSPAERDAEGRADRLAFELLAPAEMLRDETERGPLARRLVVEFGLPPLQADEYAAILLPPEADVGGLIERLRNSC